MKLRTQYTGFYWSLLPMLLVAKKDLDSPVLSLLDVILQFISSLHTMPPLNYPSGVPQSPLYSAPQSHSASSLPAYCITSCLKRRFKWSFHLEPKASHINPPFLAWSSLEKIYPYCYPKPRAKNSPTENFCFTECSLRMTWKQLLFHEAVESASC